jgi:GDPmannose 4,6-dehydratase
VRIKLGLANDLHLGILESRRDWGFTGDYVDAMWRMIQNEQPVDFVVGTGETHTVREFCEKVFSHLYLDYHDYVVQDPGFIRPAEVDLLVADPSKVRQTLGWTPKVDFCGLAEMMVDADLKSLGEEVT